MKKVLPLMLIFALIVAGCGSDEREIKIGTIKYLNVTEEQLDDVLNAAASRKIKHRHIFFDNMSTLLAGLESGQVDEISIYETVATYLKNSHPEFSWEAAEDVVYDSFCCGMRAEDIELKKEFDAAILQMSKDGTLSRLVKTYLDESFHTEAPVAVELPTIYGAPTIRIGVTGELPLLDYIRPDGEPAGFNTAVLSEISRIIEKNFILVQIDGGARAAALSSGQVDVIFWAVSPKNETVLPKNFDTPDGIILSVPYFSDEIVHVKLSK